MQLFSELQSKIVNSHTKGQTSFYGKGTRNKSIKRCTMFQIEKQCKAIFFFHVHYMITGLSYSSAKQYKVEKNLFLKKYYIPSGHGGGDPCMQKTLIFFCGDLYT